MQKLINGIALLSGMTSLIVIGSGVYVYVNMETWKSQAQERLTGLVTSAISDSLPDMLESALPEPPKMPELPNKTGGVLPF